MNIQEAIIDCYGINIGMPPEDGRMRTFPIDKFRIGFVMSGEGAKFFGCWSDGDIYYLDPRCGEWDGFQVKVQMPDKQKFNRVIVACAKGLTGRGDTLSRQDEARLKLAVEQVEISS